MRTKPRAPWLIFWAVPLLMAPSASAQFEGFVNHGLVGVGRLCASTFDKAVGGRQDTLYRFNSLGQWQETIFPPKAFVPRRGGFPGKVNFTAVTAPASGRRNNRGFEGLSITPDGKRLVASLQSPLTQDSGGTNTARNIRVLQFDADANSPAYGQVLAKHIYPLTLNGTLQAPSGGIVETCLTPPGLHDWNSFATAQGCGLNHRSFPKIRNSEWRQGVGADGAPFALELRSPGRRQKLD